MQRHRRRPVLRSLAVATLLIAAVPLVSWTRATPAQPHATMLFERTGVISGWLVQNDGTVALQVSGSMTDDAPFKVWFATPANQTTATRFENLALQTILAARASGATVTVRGDRDDNREGQSREDAIELQSIASVD